MGKQSGEKKELVKHEKIEIIDILFYSKKKEEKSDKKNSIEERIEKQNNY